jgi:hypothetical protein
MPIVTVRARLNPTIQVSWVSLVSAILMERT